MDLGIKETKISFFKLTNHDNLLLDFFEKLSVIFKSKHCLIRYDKPSMLKTTNCMLKLHKTKVSNFILKQHQRINSKNHVLLIYFHKIFTK